MGQKNCVSAKNKYGGNNTLIGREKEIIILNECYNMNESNFIAVRGKRRVEKTHLINETFANKILFRHAGIYNGNLKEQLSSFRSSLEYQGYETQSTIDINDLFN